LEIDLTLFVELKQSKNIRCHDTYHGNCLFTFSSLH